MNDVELLERAIDRLEDLTAESTPGPWFYGGQGWLFGNKRYTDDDLGHLFGSVNHIEEDGILIVALHAAIPALLDLMRCIVEFSEHVGLGEPGERPTQIQSVIDMARAILGESE